MTPIPLPMREAMAQDIYYRSCARRNELRDHVCRANPVTKREIEWEHAMTYAGRRLNEVWAIVPLCWGAHEGPDKNKEIARWLALNRATHADLERYPVVSVAWRELRQYLNGKYGVPAFGREYPSPF